jgi:hypothetical protein
MLMLLMMCLLSFAVTEWLMHQPPYADGTEMVQPPKRPHLAGLQARAHHLAVRLNRHMLQDSGMTETDYVVLAVLSEHPTGGQGPTCGLVRL